MKKMTAFISALILTLTLTACGGKEESGITNISLSTNAPEELTTTTTTEPPVEEETGYIACATREELVIGMLNALGSHDEKTFCRYFQSSSKHPTYASDLYEDFHDGFCQGLADNGLDYKAEYSYKDFEIYIFLNEDGNRTQLTDKEDLKAKKAQISVLSPSISNFNIQMIIEYDFDSETYFFPPYTVTKALRDYEVYLLISEAYAADGLTPYTETE